MEGIKGEIEAKTLKIKLSRILPFSIYSIIGRLLETPSIRGGYAAIKTGSPQATRRTRPRRFAPPRYARGGSAPPTVKTLPAPTKEHTAINHPVQGAASLVLRRADFAGCLL